MSLSTEILCAVALILHEKNRPKKVKPTRKKKEVQLREKIRHIRVLKPKPVPLNSNDFLGANCVVYQELLTLVTPLIQKPTTYLLDEIPVAQRLLITLRYLTTGNAFEEIALPNGGKIATQDVRVIVLDTCCALIRTLKNIKNIKVPETATELEDIANGFDKEWNFPHCVGAVAAKHIAITKPEHFTKSYLNHKHFSSMILIAVTNSTYEFVMVDGGISGGTTDFDLCDTALGEAFYGNSLNFPAPSPLPGGEGLSPYVFVGTDGFPMEAKFLKPYPDNGRLSKEEQIYNYRHNRAQRIAENAVGIMASKFHVLESTLNLEPKKVRAVLLVCCHLHNYLIKKHTEMYIASGVFDKEDVDTGNVEQGSWRSTFGLQNLNSTTYGDNLCSAEDVRKEFSQYFSYEGQVPWQTKFLKS